MKEPTVWLLIIRHRQWHVRNRAIASGLEFNRIKSLVISALSPSAVINCFVAIKGLKDESFFVCGCATHHAIGIDSLRHGLILKKNACLTGQARVNRIAHQPTTQQM